ncbi:hypothetical protein C5167_046600 [Papaver somniferum]|uniref:Uncharacterized protein n=1 Tax=Papaver somniferum TaxID=3469 RepID=A0A4Y7LGH7_PAPSO|nr:hypothetical protein C5167_046600 [Papaver somniferum]
MRFRSIFRVHVSRTTKSAFSLSRFETRRSFSLRCTNYERPSFGIAFDIDGVILRGFKPIGNSPQALRKLYDESGTLKIPFLFLTNANWVNLRTNCCRNWEYTGGGVPESKRASELSELLGVNVLPSQVVQGHSPFKKLVKSFENELIVAIGKGEPANVMAEYGFKKVLSMDEYASYFDNIDPLAPYKMAPNNNITSNGSPRYDVSSERVQAAFVVSDPVDWSRDIQVLCDILRTGGLPGKEIGHQPPLYFAADDLEYQTILFPVNIPSVKWSCYSTYNFFVNG